jgi:hypothetical protein
LDAQEQRIILQLLEAFCPGYVVQQHAQMCRTQHCLTAHGLCPPTESSPHHHHHHQHHTLYGLFITPAGLIEEIVVSRLGHFTCPVAAGAVFLAQHPTLPTSSSSSSNSGSGSGSAESAQMQAVLRVKQDPLVSALDNMTSFEQIQQVGWMVCLHIQQPVCIAALIV